MIKERSTTTCYCCYKQAAKDEAAYRVELKQSKLRLAETELPAKGTVAVQDMKDELHSSTEENTGASKDKLDDKVGDASSRLGFFLRAGFPGGLWCKSTCARYMRYCFALYCLNAAVTLGQVELYGKAPSPLHAFLATPHTFTALHVMITVKSKSWACLGLPSRSSMHWTVLERRSKRRVRLRLRI